MFVIAAAAVSAMGIVTTLDAVQMAHAAPNSGHGTCFGHKGASGCAGNIGGFINNRHGTRCINNGPYNVFC